MCTLANLVNCTISRHLILRTCRIIRTTMSSNDILATSDGQGANTYVEYDFVYDPSVSTTGIVIYAGVPGTLLLPLNVATPAVADSSNVAWLTGVVQWGSVSSFGRSSATFKSLEWSLLDRPSALGASSESCLHSLRGPFEGCMDSRYSNFDPKAGIQYNASSCIDTARPSLLFNVHNWTVAQFSPFFLNVTAIDAVDGNIAVVINGTVNTSVAQAY
jgi:hypothetical protein